MGRSFEISNAEREKLKFSAMFMGATGSGKTVGALMAGKGLVQAMFPELDSSSIEFWSKVGIIDTEHNRAKIYADTTINNDYIGKFLHIDFQPPYDVDGYIQAVEALKDRGCVVIIIDSFTHAWDSAGGILELHSSMGGQFATWQKINPIMKRLYGSVTADEEVHIIATVRSKMKYEATTTETGKMGVSKIGLKPIMRDDFEYEVLTALHFDEDHKVTVIKDNTHIFESGVLLKASYGKDLYGFLSEGVDVSGIRKAKLKSIVVEIQELLEKHGEERTVISLMKVIRAQAHRKYGIEDWKLLPMASLLNVLDKLKEALDIAK